MTPVTTACYAFTLPTEPDCIFFNSTLKKTATLPSLNINSSDLLTPWLPAWPLGPRAGRPQSACGQSVWSWREKKPSTRLKITDLINIYSFNTEESIETNGSNFKNCFHCKGHASML